MGPFTLTNSIKTAIQKSPRKRAIIECGRTRIFDTLRMALAWKAPVVKHGTRKHDAIATYPGAYDRGGRDPRLRLATRPVREPVFDLFLSRTVANAGAARQTRE